MRPLLVPVLATGFSLLASSPGFAAPADSAPILVAFAGDPANPESLTRYRILKENSGAHGIQIEWLDIAQPHAEVVLSTDPDATSPTLPIVRIGSEIAAPADADGWWLDDFHHQLFAGLAAAAGRPAPELPALTYEAAEVPNYEKVEPRPLAQAPLTPAESMHHIQVPPGFELKLFAAEPMVVNPIAINWDERGRLWVVETVDYPNNLQAGNIGNDRIKILTDTTGDGLADQSVIFADKLSIPTSLVFANGGVIVTNGSELLFLRDTDGDDRADERRVLIDGFRMHDTHAGPSNLRQGFDQWIWATCGYSGFNGNVGGTDHSFSSGVFRFLPDGSRLEFLQATTNNTWGLGISASGEIMGSTANSNPSWFLSVPDWAFELSGMDGSQTPRAENDATYFPITRDVRQVDAWRLPLRETSPGRSVPSSRNFTSAAGHAFYTDTRFPERYHNRAVFVCDPTGHLVATGFVDRHAADFTLTFTGENLFASSDAWSSPVAAEVGPDGAVWIADWYNLIIQHNPTPSLESAGMAAETGKGAAYVTPLRDTRHGRIYRIVPAGSPEPAERPQIHTAEPSSLIAALSSPSLLQRLHAQRLITETRPPGMLAALEQTVTGPPPADLHAFWAIAGTHGLAEPSSLAGRIVAASKDPRPLIRRAAAAAGASSLAAGDLITWLNHEQDAHALKEILLAITRLDPAETVGRELHSFHSTNKPRLAGTALREAMRVAAARHAPGFIAALRDQPLTQLPGEQPNLLDTTTFLDPGPDAPDRWHTRIFNPPQLPAGDPEITVTAEGRDGRPSLRLSSANGVDLMVAIPFTTAPGKRYRFSAWARSENVSPVDGEAAGAQLSVRAPWTISRSLRGNSPWTRLELEFDSGPGGEILAGGHLGFGGIASGTAWFEDMELRELDEAGDEPLFEALTRSLLAMPPDSPTIASLRAADDPVARFLVAAIDSKASPAPPAELPPHLAASRDRGRDLYDRTCAACHQPHGRGLEPDFPPLAGSVRVTGPPAAAALAIIHGLAGPITVAGREYNGIMPPNPQFSDQDVADVMTFIRGAFGNRAPAVTEDEITDLRARHADRTEMWTAVELAPFLDPGTDDAVPD